MKNSLYNFRTRCLEATLDLLWRQWCSLGVAGHSVSVPAGHLIDPEALLLATSSIGRHEPRLFDEVLDWSRAHGSLLNLQRLKNLQRSSHLGDGAVVEGIARWLATEAGQPRWKTFFRTEENASESEPLFIGGSALARNECDPIFLASGLERVPFLPRRMSRAPNPTLAPNLVIALRALIGVSARVEVILFLSGGSAAHASELARMTGYAPRTMQALLNEMTLSGHLLAQQPIDTGKVRKGANRVYQVQSSDWMFLTNGRPLPKWFPWTALFSLVRTVLTAIPPTAETVKHPAVISSKLREVLATHGPTLARAGLLPILDLRPEAPAEELLQTLAERLPAVIASL